MSVYCPYCDYHFPTRRAYERHVPCPEDVNDSAPINLDDFIEVTDYWNYV